MRRVLLLVVIAGCSRAELDGKFVPAVAGTWELVSQEPASSEDDRLRFLELLENGTGGLFTKKDVSGILGCPRLVHSSDSNVLTLQIGTYEETGESVLFAYERPDPDTLELTSASGEHLVFTRVSEIPAGDRCLIATTAGGIALPGSATESALAIEGSIAWYQIKFDTLLGVDVLTGSTAGRLTIANFGLGTMEGTDFWGQEPFTSPVMIERRAKSGAVLDTFAVVVSNDGGDRGLPMAWDGVALWMLRQNSSFQTELLRVDTAAEPDTAIATVPADDSMSSIAYRGTPWALASSWGTVLVEIDPSTGVALRTYTLPRPQGSWAAITADGTSFYLLDQSSPGRIVLLATP